MRLIMVCGLPGTGKTTVAKKIADSTKSFVFNTDVLRKELFDDPDYSKREKELVYNLLFEMAGKFLMTAKNVVLDGTFYKKELRERGEELAEKMKSDFHVVEVVCEEKTVKERLVKRKGGVSDADYGVYLKLKKQFEPIKGKHAVIESGKKEDAQIKRFLKSI